VAQKRKNTKNRTSQSLVALSLDHSEAKDKKLNYPDSFNDNHFIDIILPFNQKEFIVYVESKGTFITDFRSSWRFVSKDWIPVKFLNGSILAKQVKEERLIFGNIDTTGQVLWQTPVTQAPNLKDEIYYYAANVIKLDSLLFLFVPTAEKNHLVVDLTAGNVAPNSIQKRLSEYRFEFHSPMGLVFRNRNTKELYIVKNGQIERAEFYNKIERLIAPDQLGIERPLFVWKHSNWLPTKNGFVHLQCLQSKQADRGIIAQETGLSSRGLDFYQDSLLYVGIHTAAFKIFELNAGSDELNQKQHVFFPNAKGTSYFIERTDSSLSLITNNSYHHMHFRGGESTLTNNPEPEGSEVFGYVRLPNGQRIIGGNDDLYYWSPHQAEKDLVIIERVGCGDFPNIAVNRLRFDTLSRELLVCSDHGLFIGSLDDSNHQFHCQQFFEVGSVHDAYIRDTHQLIIATQTKGILVYDLRTGEKEYRFDKENHLQHNYCHNLLEDDSGRIWASSQDGLYVIDFEYRWLQELNQKDGLVNYEFNRLASAKSSSGLLAFGGINGISILDPNHFNFVRTAKPVTVNALFGLRIDKKVSERISPLRSSDSSVEFKISDKIRSIRPTFPTAGIQSDYTLYFRRKGEDLFWMKTHNNYLPTTSVEQDQTLELLWTREEEWLKSEIRLIYPTAVTKYAWILAILIVFAFAFLLKKRNASLPTKRDPEPDPEPTQGKDDTVPPSTDPVGPPTPLQAYLQELNQIENEKYKFTSELQSKFMKELNLLIEEHISDPDFSIEFLAGKMHLSGRQFHRKVLKYTGFTPVKYFTILRLIKAKEILLENIDARIAEVAASVGYKSPSYLSKKFKTLYGINPTEFVDRVLELKGQGNTKNT
jgi:AraC-like DNA-binding protein